jgi:hypothetical protein
MCLQKTGVILSEAKNPYGLDPSLTLRMTKNGEVSGHKTIKICTFKSKKCLLASK